ncbi:MAG: hypothetical protein H6840_09145 [Planctomycetes bacterium]|nr:hypothetical protein [Planctomycetota bacterium]
MFFMVPPAAEGVNCIYTLCTLRSTGSLCFIQSLIPSGYLPMLVYPSFTAARAALEEAFQPGSVQ